MSSDMVKVSVMLRKHGFCGVVTVFNGGMHIWSETIPTLRTTMVDALRDAVARRADLLDSRK